MTELKHHDKLLTSADLFVHTDSFYITGAPNVVVQYKSVNI